MDINNQTKVWDVPTIDRPRSKFSYIQRRLTTTNAGELKFIFSKQMIPGDTFKIDMSSVTRMTTPLFPVMDNAYLDVFFFAVPNRLLWDHQKEFHGENTTTAWEQQVEYEIPQITAPAGGWQVGSLADSLGYPTGVENVSYSRLPFNAYTLIVNEWFRDQNLQNPAYFSKGDETIAGSNGDDYTTDIAKGGKPFMANKYHDYFTSATPDVQKGPEVLLPLGTSAPVYGAGGALKFVSQNDPTIPMYLATDSGKVTAVEVANYDMSITHPSGGIRIPTKEDNQGYAMKVDLTNATSAPISELYKAYAIQELLWRDSVGGTRYREIIKNHFSVNSPDARMQIPEYIGGKRIPINMDQVVQTSESTATSPQGSTAAYSHTQDVENSIVNYSSTEWELLIGLAVIRTDHTYSQGVDKEWTRKKRFDYYYPELGNIANTAIYNKEIYAQGTAEDDEVFGYQEAWAEMRYARNEITGQMRPTYAQSLSYMHYGDKYDTLPTLSSDWIKETTANIDRTIAVQSNQADQFQQDFAFRVECTRPMPLYSIPGLRAL